MLRLRRWEASFKAGLRLSRSKLPQGGASVECGRSFSFGGALVACGRSFRKAGLRLSRSKLPQGGALVE